jgi:RimJ/RimL family protein N-acetyltransferase
VSLTVRPLRAGETALLRDLRLRALADSPRAFGATLEQEAAMASEEWEQRARENARGQRSAAFVLEMDGGACGMAVGALQDGDPQLAHLFGLWVGPAARGAGGGARLVEAVADWAGRRGARRLRASLADGNPAAAALYERLRFASTGERESLGHDGLATSILMREL